MKKGSVKRRTTEPSSRSILEMTAKDARSFFLRHESYCNFEMPPYFQFDKFLAGLSTHLATEPLESQIATKPCEFDGVNYVMVSNKDGKYAWRPLQLCHPAIYVQLVHDITAPSNWKHITDRFAVFAGNPKLQCLSVPIESKTGQSDKAEQIIRWWQQIEQRSIELSLDFDVLAHADITDCYGALYTHSIAWALHTQQVAKASKNDFKLIGNLIDSRIRDMSYGQTNGIPQGSVLMDFVAEVVLGYLDTVITAKLVSANITDYHILRYRDDYRIFTRHDQEAERILKCISESLAENGLKLNTAKTVITRAIVTDSIKSDKIAWASGAQRHANLQKHLLLIHNHGSRYPNSASLVRALNDFHRRIIPIKTAPAQLLPLVSIIVDIAFQSPKVYAISMAILSKFVDMVKGTDAKHAILERVLKKFSRIPNTGHLEVWLQRIALPIRDSQVFGEPLCRLASGEKIELWNNQWIASKKLKAFLSADRIVNQAERKKLKPVIPREEVQVFGGYY